MRTFSPLQLLYLVPIASAAGCGADLTLPADGNPARLQAVSGSGRSHRRHSTARSSRSSVDRSGWAIRG